MNLIASVYYSCFTEPSLEKTCLATYNDKWRLTEAHRPSCIGVKGSIFGTFLGVLLISLLQVGLPFIGLNANLQLLVTGNEYYVQGVRGALPPDLKRGVLSQDALYDLLAENRR